MAKPVRHRPADDPTRLKLLEAGRQLLHKRGADEVVDIRLADACAHARVTTGAAYPIWENQRAYQADLAKFLASTIDRAGPATIEAELAQAVAECDTPEAALRRIGPVYFERFVSNEDFYLALRFWSVRRPSAELRRSLRGSYRIMHEAFREVFAAMLAHYERDLRDGYTLDELTAMVTSTTEGFAIRHRIDPKPPKGTRAAGQLYAETLVALLHELTVPTNT